MRKITLASLLIISLFSSCAATADYYGYDRTEYAYRGSYTPFNGYIAATGGKTIIVDPNTHMWAAYAGDGSLVRWGRASLGKNYCPDLGRGCRTVTGTFRINDKGGPGCISHRFPLETHGGAHTPYCMHFYKGYALHGSYDVPNHNASHGCIRVPVEDAQWLNQEFAEVGTKVVVKPYSAVSTPRRNQYRYSYDTENEYDNPNYQAVGDNMNYEQSESDQYSYQNDAAGNKVVYLYSDDLQYNQ